MKLKVFALLLLALITFSCNNDDDEPDFDPQEQSNIDDETLVSFLQSHYLNADKRVDTIMNGETPLYSQVEVQEITHEDVKYKLYIYKEFEGIGINPSRYDSIQVLYEGFKLDSVKFDQNQSYTSERSWLYLPNLIEGWRYGFPHFKSGRRVIGDSEDFWYEDAGKGILFIPSGLAYGRNGSTAIPENTPIYFYVELGNVVYADEDHDHVVNNDEDINNDGDLTNDDTDGDGYPDYRDRDDDGDGKMTIDEDPDGDGNPMNDDSDGDGIPDYLDKDS